MGAGLFTAGGCQCSSSEKHASKKDTETFIDILLTMGISFDDEPDQNTIQVIIDLASTYRTTTYDAKYIYLAQNSNVN